MRGGGESRERGKYNSALGDIPIQILRKQYDKNDDEK